MRGERPSLPESWPQGLRALLASAWHPDFRQRPTAEQVVFSLQVIKDQLAAQGEGLSSSATSAGNNVVDGSQERSSRVPHALSLALASPSRRGGRADVVPSLAQATPASASASAAATAAARRRFSFPLLSRKTRAASYERRRWTWKGSRTSAPSSSSFISYTKRFEPILPVGDSPSPSTLGHPWQDRLEGARDGTVRAARDNVSSVEEGHIRNSSNATTAGSSVIWGEENNDVDSKGNPREFRPGGRGHMGDNDHLSSFETTTSSSSFLCPAHRGEECGSAGLREAIMEALKRDTPGAPAPDTAPGKEEGQEKDEAYREEESDVYEKDVGGEELWGERKEKEEDGEGEDMAEKDDEGEGVVLQNDEDVGVDRKDGAVASERVDRRGGAASAAAARVRYASTTAESFRSLWSLASSSTATTVAASGDAKKSTKRPRAWTACWCCDSTIGVIDQSHTALSLALDALNESRSFSDDGRGVDEQEGEEDMRSVYEGGTTGRFDTIWATTVRELK